MKYLTQLSHVALKVQRDYHADAKRIERASQIVRDEQVRRIINQRYAVRSQSKSAEYLVNLDLVECGCPDAQRDNLCKHFLACAIYHALPDVSQNDRVNAECRRMLQSVGIGV